MHDASPSRPHATPRPQPVPDYVQERLMAEARARRTRRRGRAFLVWPLLALALLLVIACLA